MYPVAYQWTVAVAGEEVPVEFVSVTVTDAIVAGLPPIVKGTVSLNWDPVANDAELAYHAVNTELTSSVKSAEASDAPAAGVK